MKWIKTNKAIAAVFLSALIMLLVVVFVRAKENVSVEIEKEWTLEQLLEETAEEESVTGGSGVASEGRPFEETVFVDIKGAVSFPGVYQMQQGQRVIDVLQKAGGLLEEADSVTVNFAETLRDEMLIYIPFEGEELLIYTLEESGSSAVALIDLNSATMDELTQLSGIGPAKAQAIIAYREENGQFMTTEEIKQVSGIGDKTFENIQEQITVY
ncbi:Late competence protein ComEA, DNA receptor [Alkalibacterium sp. AK22]|uniref:helix-hairpin-helix domain-containing protein n=1 Tax=Alkalibacterium sp. AK22 TaxID=1229520 RepID=UPI00044869A2|nr:helix-hairpin-helix domain-containing protein [Alkalibacterium sp. AK22]EXJ24270.1 Late competence protein ComEA, DNA receptor [Alkalibacterium sp. AK22]